MIPQLTEHRILVVDDEPDIHAVTRLSLKSMRYHDRKVVIDSAASGKEAVAYLREHPDTAVILLDVVMESQTAGLDACRAIREDVGNRFVRILLRTGQPGIAPERKTIDEYDIDGYLAKTELTSHRLYAAVRTAIKAFDELIELERHKEILGFVHETVLAMHSFEPLEASLQRVLTAASAVTAAPLAMLELVTVEEEGNPRRLLLHVARSGSSRDAASMEALATRISAGLSGNAASGGSATSATGPTPLEGGYLLPIRLHRDLGHGWLWLEGEPPDRPGMQALTLLASHAANALYSTVAQAVLRARDDQPLFQELSI